MYALIDAWQGVRNFMDQGGVILYAIAVLIFIMWTFIIERIWYFKTSLHRDIDQTLAVWEARSERQSTHAHQIREALISRASEKIDQFMPLIKTMVTLSPLFGLLGTVTGMIAVFEIMAITGGGDAKSMSGGVSKATIPTMSGMVAAISGVLGYTYLERIASREKKLLEDHLATDH
ncbi:MAG: MotA/TolQ/ExbB proton channel family protein [Porticoccaceae bacterium]|nr:MotA/TolQ/ExbB proton channel family protein [Porticoccaceae bacterium]